jgi:hypothetical protein
MFSPGPTRRLAQAVLLGLLLTATAACEEDEGPSAEDELEFVAIRLQLGDAVFTSTGGSPLTPAPTLGRGNRPVSVTALDAAGAVVNLTSDYTLNITQVSGVAVPFTRTTNLSGTLNAATPGQAVLRLQIVHQGHADYEISQLTINVN